MLVRFGGVVIGGPQDAPRPWCWSTEPRGILALADRVRPDAAVGNGVNDASAVAAAHLGLARGRHSPDLALETSDAVIVRDELATVARVIDLSRHARRVVTANLIIAASLSTALVAWDLAGHLPLPLGVAGHEGSTVIVGLNGLTAPGLRLAPRRPTGSTGAGRVLTDVVGRCGRPSVGGLLKAGDPRQDRCRTAPTGW